MGRDDIVLCDTGAVKMWMARLYPTYRPNTCLISNGLATMAFSLPGAFAAKLVHPERRVLAAMGDGAFAMSMAEIETAVREGVHFVDPGVGRRRLRADRVEAGHPLRAHGGGRRSTTRTSSSSRRASAPRATRSARPTSSLPTLEKALADDAVSIIACPVDYARERPADRTAGRPHRIDLTGRRGRTSVPGLARGRADRIEATAPTPNSPGRA